MSHSRRSVRSQCPAPRWAVHTLARRFAAVRADRLRLETSARTRAATSAGGSLGVEVPVRPSPSASGVRRRAPGRAGVRWYSYRGGCRCTAPAGSRRPPPACAASPSRMSRDAPVLRTIWSKRRTPWLSSRTASSVRARPPGRARRRWSIPGPAALRLDALRHAAHPRTVGCVIQTFRTSRPARTVPIGRPQRSTSARQRRSMIVALAIPPASHIVCSPYRPPVPPGCAAGSS